MKAEVSYNTIRGVKMSLQIKKAETEKDIEQIATAAAEIWEEHYITIISREQIDYMVERFQSKEAITDQIEKEGYGYYLLLDQGVIAGFISIKIEEKEIPSLFLSKFYIRKECRGKGFGKAAMGFLEAVCKENKLKKIWLTVNRNNSNSINIYEKFGFKKIRTQVNDIGNGFVMDDFVMEREESF